MVEPSRAERELLAVLRDVLEEVDPVPAGLADAARAALSWRTVDAELAELVADSALEQAGVRSTRAPRLLTFTAAETTLVVEVAAPTPPAQAGRRLIGQIVAPRAVEVEVRHSDGSLTVTADEYGRFRAEPVPPGPISLACRFPGTEIADVVTSWVVI